MTRALLLLATAAMVVAMAGCVDKPAPHLEARVTYEPFRSRGVLVMMPKWAIAKRAGVDTVLVSVARPSTYPELDQWGEWKHTFSDTLVIVEDGVRWKVYYAIATEARRVP